LRTYFNTSLGLVKAVDGVNFGIDQKQTVGLVGESGSGKTVTALSIMRLVPKPGEVVGGKIYFEGKDLLRLKSDEIRKIRGNRISMIFQDPSTYLNPIMKIGDQIAETIQQHQNMTKRGVNEKVVEMLDLVRLPDPSSLVNYYPYQLSGGMRQRILLAMALSCNPSLVIADELTTALDVTIQAQIMDLLGKLRREFEISLLLITHDLGIVAEICDEVNVMYAGKIVETADVDSIYENPRHPYTEGLLRSVFSLDEFKERIETIGGVMPDPTHFPSGCRFHPRCLQASDVCSKSYPPAVEVEKGHIVSCWLCA
jgi:peptide/nickel transport system ATP-binding protein